MFLILYAVKDRDAMKTSTAASPYQKPLKSVRPPLIPTEDEQEKHQEGFFGSLGKLFANGGAWIPEILGGIIPGFRKKSLSYQYQNQPEKHPNSWPVQDSFVILDEDEPPSVETRTSTPRKTYPFMSKDVENMHQWRQSRAFYTGWDDDFQQQQHNHRYQSTIPQTYYEKTCEKTNGIVFGAVQEQDEKREAVVSEPVDCGNPIFNHRSFRSRTNSMGYSNGY